MVSHIKIVALFGLLILLGGGSAFAEPSRPLSGQIHSNVTRMDLYLAAGDYRRALETCQREIDDAPSAASYIHLTYVYQAIDAYLEHLSQEERWMAVEHLYLNLAYRDTEDFVDPPGGLARMAKEMIQASGDIKLLGGLFLIVGAVDLVIIVLFPFYALKLFGTAVTGSLSFLVKLHSPAVHLLIGYGFLASLGPGASAWGVCGIRDSERSDESTRPRIPHGPFKIHRDHRFVRHLFVLAPATLH